MLSPMLVLVILMTCLGAGGLYFSLKKPKGTPSFIVALVSTGLLGGALQGVVHLVS